MNPSLQDRTADILGKEWIGLVAGAMLAGAAVAAASAGVTLWVVATCGLLGLLSAVGSVAHLLTVSRAWRRYPAPGKRVDVGGHKMHVLAEGVADGTLPVVLLSGGHASGATVDHLHRALRETTRSILIDRFGTGWSDTGPFPRTTVREVDEVLAALDAAGETGPFVFAGYSFGGLLAANIARRYPDRVARLVLLDPTPLETLVFGPRLGSIPQMRRDSLHTALARLIGWNVDFSERRIKRNPAHAASGRAFETRLGDALVRLKGIEVNAGGRLAEWSIYRELVGSHIADNGWEMSVYDGDLGDMSVWLVAPGTSDEVASTPEVGQADATAAARMFRFFQRSRERYLATSTNARRVVAPPGSTHQFVYEHSDFVIATLREAVEA